MEHIKVLEAKLKQLVSLVKDLKKENAELEKDKLSLQGKVEELEFAAMSGKEQVAEEKALTKEVVDDLIKSIDSLVGSEEVA